MKTSALAFAVMLIAAPAFAQDAAPVVTSPAPPPPAMMPVSAPAEAAPVGEIKQDTQAIHETSKDIHDMKQERRQDLKAGDKTSAKEATKEIKDLRKVRHDQRKDRRQDVRAKRHKEVNLL